MEMVSMFIVTIVHFLDVRPDSRIQAIQYLLF